MSQGRVYYQLRLLQTFTGIIGTALFRGGLRLESFQNEHQSMLYKNENPLKTLKFCIEILWCAQQTFLRNAIVSVGLFVQFQL